MSVRGVVVAGESLVDMVEAAPGRFAAHLGGGPFNAARAIGRLAQPVAFLGCLSTDTFGRQHRQQLHEDGVSLRCVRTSPLPTTLALAELDGDGSATYRFYTEATAAADLDREQALELLGAPPAALHVGTLGLVLEPLGAALEAVVDAASPDTIVFLDPNCRPDATADPDAYRARVQRILGRADVVKVSEDDLAFLAPGEEPVAAAQALLPRGASVVLLTRGGAGAFVVTARETIAVPAVPAQVVDTIGAGDAFGAGFLVDWLRQGLGRRQLGDLASLLDAANFAALVAAKTCERAGADPPRAGELR